MTEFSIIEKYFKKSSIKRHDVVLGIGDDAAILQCSSDQHLLLSTDTLVENTHFLPDLNPCDLGYRSLAVNLSDLAAMGAEPAWALLSLTLPSISESWVESFSEGFFELVNMQKMSLVGGNMSRGPLSITVQIAGFCPKFQALIRSGAKVGDYIYVTGKIGNALIRPIPRVQEGIALRQIANSCIDISDGLLADLNHILESSSVGATIHLENIPVDLVDRAAAVTRGEDYELCFTVPESKINHLPIAATCIGRIEKNQGLRVLQNNKNIHINHWGYQHF
jgi:thiamine-monophosphate kinase